MRKLLCSFMCCLLILSFTGCTNTEKAQEKPTPTTDTAIEKTDAQIAFDELLLEIYKDNVSSDALTLHYSLMDPKAYGIELEEISVGDLQEEMFESNDELAETIKKLNAVDAKELTSIQQEDLEVVKAYYESVQSSVGLEYYQWLFTPSKSLTSNFITNFVEFKFYSEEDIETYLTLLADTPRYFNQALDFTQTQVEMGLFMQDVAIEGTQTEIEKFIAKTENNELIISFEDKLESMNIDSSKKEEFTQRNREIVLNEIIPTYQNVKDSLEGWKGSATTEGGLASLPQGKEYYEVLLRTKVGYQGEMDELFSLGETALQEIMNDIMMLVYSDSELLDRYSNVASYLDEKTPEEILAMYQEKLLEEYPAGPEVVYTAQYLDPSIANDSVIAYYLIPPLDNIKENVIKINPTHTTDSLDTLYSTLAHEGFPGHCYQFTYYMNINNTPLRSDLSFLGYSEGWAMNVEFDAYKWILPEDQELADFLGLETYYLYLIQSMIDMGVNYYNWDQATLKSWLDDYGAIYGLNNDETVKLLYDQSIGDPCLLNPYGMGLMLHRNLQAKAEKALGDKFDIVSYHKVILDGGQMPFGILEKRVDSYIAENK